MEGYNSNTFGLYCAKKSIMTSRDVWNENCTDFEACDGMPAQGTKKYN